MNNKQKEYYEKTASKYDQMHLGPDEHAIALAHMHALSGAYGIRSFLDVGTGTGRTVEFLLKRGYEVKGIEPVRALIEVGLRKGRYAPNVVLEGYGDKLPFPDKSFDGVCEYGVLHHVKYPERVIAEMMRVSRKAVFISDSNRYGQGNYITKRLKYLLNVARLWKCAYALRTWGKGYNYSEGDGVAYSYSVYDSIKQIKKEYKQIILIPTGISLKTRGNRLYPLFESRSMLLCAFSENIDIHYRLADGQRTS
jgi:ubiquinone/menaquinone biosynthesis C-methylase UbiE